MKILAMMTTTRLTRQAIHERYNGRWILFTDPLTDKSTGIWTEAVVLADAPPEDQAVLFRLAEQLHLSDAGIYFIGDNPYSHHFLL